MVAEQNLLIGILAVQLELATPQELVNAGAQWAVNQERDLCIILLEQGTITARQADLLRQLSDPAEFCRLNCLRSGFRNHVPLNWRGYSPAR
jgi:hypothetical protein